MNWEDLTKELNNLKEVIAQRKESLKWYVCNYFYVIFYLKQQSIKWLKKLCIVGIVATNIIALVTFAEQQTGNTAVI